MSEKYFSGSLPFFSYILVMFIEQPPFFYRMLFPETIWRIPGDKKTVYLTFDDGPIPQVTPWVLDVLDYYEVKARFFVSVTMSRVIPICFR